MQAFSINDVLFGKKPTGGGVEVALETNTPALSQWRSCLLRTQAQAAELVKEPSFVALVLSLDSLATELEQLEEASCASNLMISYKTDQTLRGQEDYWATPLETLQAMAGDCEDYAILKYWLLKAVGIDPTQMWIAGFITPMGGHTVLRVGDALLSNIFDNAHDIKEFDLWKPEFQVNEQHTLLF